MIKKTKIDKDVLAVIKAEQKKVEANTAELERLAISNQQITDGIWKLIHTEYPETKSDGGNVYINYKTGVITIWESFGDELKDGVGKLKNLAVRTNKYQIAASLRDIERALLAEKP